MTRQQMLVSAQTKAVIARFTGDQKMWREALRLYFHAITGTAKQH